ncbi:hypothetical protein D0Z07_1526 [Hyphodiscus hymeniophilus]|uniref:Xylanolytic transcriptional activator regulatory domain-containing protein n=1 Tax=Hyphodiscus hymeniophilus TaxID=353542 RepID=A0A9P7AZI6_9HELO|nr:hypothetical protein D0Z07_1526 [Hyphodiscus hymeniophilus]
MASGEAPISASRSRQLISRRACDGCRERKIKVSRVVHPLTSSRLTIYHQCSWVGGVSCDGCATAGIFCTFVTQRKRRGRPDRVIESLRTGISASSQHEDPSLLRHLEPLRLATANIAIEHLCPIGIFETIIDDYFEEIYVIAPIVHIPTFKQGLSTFQYISDAHFLRLCLSLCAMTIASSLKKITVYGFGYYLNAKDMVNRACQLVTASRIATSPDWADEPSSNDLICSLLLGTASHYTESPRRGWIYINESIHCCRNLNLYSPAGYDGMDILGKEINKRAFWMLYIVQM